MSGTTSILGPENEIEIYRGSSKTYELTVVDAESEAVDLTSARIVLSVKCALDDQAPLIQKDSNVGAAEVDITHPKEGIAEIKFVPGDTHTMDVGEYIFDVWVVLASGTRGPVILPSPFKVVAGVTVLT
jgi:hypothetical protein